MDLSQFLSFFDGVFSNGCRMCHPRPNLPMKFDESSQIFCPRALKVRVFTMFCPQKVLEMSLGAKKFFQRQIYSLADIFSEKNIFSPEKIMPSLKIVGKKIKMAARRILWHFREQLGLTPWTANLSIAGLSKLLRISRHILYFLHQRNEVYRLVVSVVAHLHASELLMRFCGKV